MNDMQKELAFVNRRFDRDAHSFAAIYQDDGNKLSKWFNKNFRKPIFERFDIALNTIGDARGKNIIDVGCGSGIYMLSLAEKGASRVVGVDFSNAMLNIAEEKIKDKGLANVCELQHGNFLETEFLEKFDYAIAMGVFDYLPDPVTFLQKLKSITSGKIIASFPCDSLVRGSLRKLRYLLTSRGSVYYYTRLQLNNLAQTVGFSHYELVPIKTGKGFVLIATS